MSHELLTPLNAVIGFADAMAMEHKQNGSDPKHVEMCQIISRNGDQVLKIVQDVLNIADTANARILSAHQEIVDLKEVVIFCLKVIAKDMKPKRIRLIWNPEMAPVKVRGNRIHLQQAVLNLLSNAVKFNHDGGRIKVDLRLQADNSVALDVIDDGIGIKAGDIDRMIEPFEQADNSYSRRYEGVGLGLSVVQKIMAFHNGEIRLRSALGKGTCATLLFPQAYTESADQSRSINSEKINNSSIGSAA